MQWWIGQVTDPDKGEWGDSYERKQAEDGEDIYSLRCRVRIVGYHGNDVDLPDKDLPLAHVPYHQTHLQLVVVVKHYNIKVEKL